MSKLKGNANWRKLILELFVVFLGVSAGFILNNWRASQDNIQLEQKYIQSFIQNLDSNIVQINESLSLDTVKLSSLESNLTLMQQNKFPKDSIPAVFSLVVSVSKTILYESAYEDIKYSGNLNIIRDFSVKEKIVAYHNSIEGSRYVETYYNGFFYDFSLPFTMEEFDTLTGKLLNYNKRTMTKFGNICGGYYSMLDRRIEVSLNLLQESKQLKDELNNYLNNNF